MCEVPLPIPPLVLEAFPDEIGFTVMEKISLRNAWNLIIPFMDVYAKEHFLAFYSEHELLLNSFRGKTGNFDLQKLHSHSYNIFKCIEAVIFEGLEGVTQMHGIVHPVVVHHHQKSVTNSQIELMAKHWSEYLKGVLHRELAPTLEKAIDKICKIIVAVHE